MSASIGIRVCCAAAAISLAVGACTAVETVPARQDLGGHVDFQVGGGFAGVRQYLSISDEGQAVARDEKRGTEARQQLDAAQLAHIRAAFAKVASSEDRKLSRRCADCIQYSVSATIDGARHQATLVAGAQETSSYGEVISLLSKILQETLSRSAKTGS
jgi:hypothetical protein